MSDQAWVSIQTPFQPDELEHWLDDFELLMRINPWYEIRRWQPLAENRAQISLFHLGKGYLLETELHWQRQPRCLIIHYQDGLKQSTQLRVEEQNGQGVLKIIDDYADLDEEQKKQRLDEVDNSLQVWGQALYLHFRAYQRWHKLPFWRRFMHRFWYRMKPSARRISLWIFWISVAEIALFLLLIAILVIEST